MAKTGKVAQIEINPVATCDTPPRQPSSRQRLLSGLSAIAFLGALSLPVTVDTTSFAPGLATAKAVGNGLGSGNGDGQGKGRGNGKGQGDENGGGRKPPTDLGDDDDQDEDDDDPGDDDDQDEDEPGRTAEDRSGGDGEYGEADEADFADALDDAGQAPDEAIGERTATALPTVKQIFSLGEDSVLSAEQELLAIENGWNVQN